MDNTVFCQSCAMPLRTSEDKGTEKDGSRSEEYCHYCYMDGEFTKDETMEEMIDTCIPIELEMGIYPDENTARESMMSYFPNLKRWKKESAE